MMVATVHESLQQQQQHLRVSRQWVEVVPLLDQLESVSLLLLNLSVYNNRSCFLITEVIHLK